MRVLNVIVDFLIEHRKAIGNLTVVIGAYFSWLLLVKTATVAWNTVIGVGKAVMTAYRTSIILGRIAVLAFTQGVGAATHAMRLLNTVVKANPFGLILSVIAAVVIAIKSLVDRTSEYTKKMREARNTAATYTEELQKEMRTIDTLMGKLEAAKKGTKEYKNVKDEIIKQYGKYLKGLINERGEITNLAAAYNRLAAAARIAAKERSIQTARETADETHRESFKDLAKKLQQSLLDEGKSLKDAVRITNSVVYQLETTGTLSADLVTELQAIKGNLWDAKGMTDHPVNLVNEMISHKTEYNETMSAIDQIERENNPLATYSTTELKRIIPYLEEKANANQGGTIVLGMDKPNPTTRTMTAAEVKEFLDEARARLSVLETPTVDPVAGNPDFTLDDYTQYESDKDRKAREAAEKRAQIKARKDFKEALQGAKGTWESDTAQNVSDYSAGLKSWTDFLLRKHELELKYYTDREDVYKRFNLTEDEDYQELLKKKAEYEAEWLKKNAALKVEEAKRMQSAEETQAQMDFYTPGNALYGKEEALQQKLFEIKVKYLKKMQAAYNQASEEWHNYQVQIEQTESAEQLRRQKLLAQRIAEWKKRYEYQEASQRLKLELDLLEEAHQKQLISEDEYQRAKADLKKKYATEYMPESAKPSEGSADQQALAMKRDMDVIKSLYDQGIIDKEQYEKAKDRIERSYRKKSLDGIRRFGSQETNQLLDIYEAWKNFFDSTEEDGGNWATRLASLASSVFAVMSAGMQQASEYMQACTDLEVAKAEKKYNREIELAEGNSYKVKKAEKQKEKEIAKMKSEAARKQFAMQVIQAVAQTATNALNAYGSAAQVPVIGYILAPIAAAMAVAAGAIQIATIKKQQQASEAQGYSEGGFTPPGRKDEPVGTVHAGEWVASQKLVNNPRTRPLLEALDYAQRTNTIGSLTASDVSRSITAPMVLASQPAAQPVVVQSAPPTVVIEQNSEYASTMRRLADRLNEPFVTVNTVSGDHGIQQAQDEYDRLMKNKSPKSKK
ncbi:MAG: SHOCT domain-containing protein [Muribaculaceae bacterium]